MNDEAKEIIQLFTGMLEKVTGDGQKKRNAGTKPHWMVDQSHEAAVFSHLNKWKHGEKADPDSGAHPLVHAAWRCLAIAFQETHTLDVYQRFYHKDDGRHLPFGEFRCLLCGTWEKQDANHVCNPVVVAQLGERCTFHNPNFPERNCQHSGLPMSVWCKHCRHDWEVHHE